MAIYSLIPAGCGLWDIGLQGKSKLGSLAWADAITVCFELNNGTPDELLQRQRPLRSGVAAGTDQGRPDTGRRG